MVVNPAVASNARVVLSSFLFIITLFPDADFELLLPIGVEIAISQLYILKLQKSIFKTAEVVTGGAHVSFQSQPRALTHRNA